MRESVTMSCASIGRTEPAAALAIADADSSHSTPESGRSVGAGPLVVNFPGGETAEAVVGGAWTVTNGSRLHRQDLTVGQEGSSSNKSAASKVLR